MIKLIFEGCKDEGLEAVAKPDGLDLPQAALRTFVMVLSRPTLAMLLMEAIVAANQSPEPVAPAPALTAVDQMVTVEEACKLLRHERRWLWRHKHLPFVRQTGPRSMVCSKRGIENWLAARRPKC